MTRRGIGASVVLAVAGWTAPTSAPAQEIVVEETSTVAAFGEPSVLLSVGAVVDIDEIDTEARILGTAIETAIRDQSLSPPDRIHVPGVVDGVPLSVGDRIQTYRRARTVVDPVTEEALGELLLPTGVAEVEDVAGRVATAGLRRTYRAVQVGDHVRRIGRADTTPRGGRAGSGEARGSLVAFQEEKAVHPPFDVAFLRDDARALGAGDVVLLYREDEAGGGWKLPVVRLGTAVVVRPGPVAAAILTRTFRSDIEPGVRYRTTDEDPF